MGLDTHGLLHRRQPSIRCRTAWSFSGFRRLSSRQDPSGRHDPVCLEIASWKQLENVPVERWRTHGRAAAGSRSSGCRSCGEARRELPAASAAFIWATIQRLYAARRTGLNQEMFGYVPGGYAPMLERFAEVLGEEGVEFGWAHGDNRSRGWRGACA